MSQLLKHLTNIAIILISASPSYAESMNTFSLGSIAPDLKLTSGSGLKLALSSYFDQHRIVLLFVPAECSNEAEGYLKCLSKDQKSLEDRNLKIIAVVENGSALQKKKFDSNIIVVTSDEHIASGISPNAEAAPLFVLIGKDKTVKLREPKFVGNKALFATIDAMPMRQNEIIKNHK